MAYLKLKELENMANSCKNTKWIEKDGQLQVIDSNKEELTIGQTNISVECNHMVMSSDGSSHRETKIIGTSEPSIPYTYDIFLSHSYVDKIYIKHLAEILTDSGLSVFIDWLEPTLFNRSNAKENAVKIKMTMNNCKSLLYAVTDNSKPSIWMPWELGVFDGLKGKSMVLPLLTNDDDVYKGSEYTCLYPLVEYLDESFFISDLNKSLPDFIHQVGEIS